MTVGEVGSLAAKVGERRREREERRGRLITLTIPGYRDLLAAKYRRLDGDDVSALAARPDIDEDDLAGPLDVLITACVDVLEVTGTDESGQPVTESLGKRWTAQTVAEVFGLEFPDGTPVRAALREALDYKEISQHFREYAAEVQSLEAEHVEAAPGESKPSVEG